MDGVHMSFEGKARRKASRAFRTPIAIVHGDLRGAGFSGTRQPSLGKTRLIFDRLIIDRRRGTHFRGPVRRLHLLRLLLMISVLDARRRCER